MKYLVLYFSLIPMLLGLIIYLYFRSDYFVVCNVLDFIFSERISSKIYTIQWNWISVPEVLIDSLPSALWIFSASLMSTRIATKKRISWYLWLLLPITYSLSLECLQKYNVTDGTFDVNDVVFSLVGWLFAMCIGIIIDSCSKAIKIKTYHALIFYLILILGNVQ